MTLFLPFLTKVHWNEKQCVEIHTFKLLFLSLISCLHFRCVYVLPPGHTYARMCLHQCTSICTYIWRYIEKTAVNKHICRLKHCFTDCSQFNAGESLISFRTAKLAEHGDRPCVYKEYDVTYYDYVIHLLHFGSSYGGSQGFDIGDISVIIANVWSRFHGES